MTDPIWGGEACMVAAARAARGRSCPSPDWPGVNPPMTFGASSSRPARLVRAQAEGSGHRHGVQVRRREFDGAAEPARQRAELEPRRGLDDRAEAVEGAAAQGRGG